MTCYSSMRTVWQTGAAVLLAGVAGCGDDIGYLNAADYPPVEIIRSVFSDPRFDTTVPQRQVHFRNDTLYYRDPHSMHLRIVAHPISGGRVSPPVNLVDEPLAIGDFPDDNLWLDGERLIYQEGQQLNAVPLTGGQPETVLTVSE